MADNMDRNDDDWTDAPVCLKSGIWQHFKSSKCKSKRAVLCSHCKAVLSYNSGNTSGMKRHMSRHHPNVAVYETRRGNKPKPKAKVATSEAQPTNPACGRTSTSVQMTVSTYFSCIKKGSARDSNITNALMKYIVKDLRPFSVVENDGFVEFVRVLEPKYRLPSRTTLSEVELPRLYEEVKRKVTEDLKQAERIALTTDGWTSRATEGYITVTAHFIDQKWRMKSYNLQTRVLEEKHTGVNIGQVLQECIDEWDMQDKRCCLVTDNAANMATAARTAGISLHIGCFAHSLNLAAQRGLRENKVAQLLSKVRHISTFFHKSNTATAVLKHKQTLCEVPKHKLKVDVKTRWNSTYDMITRFLEQSEAVYAALSDPKVKKENIQSLKETDIADLTCLRDVLKPLKDATVMMCEEKTPTISMLVPMAEQLKHCFQPSENDSGLIASCKKSMGTDWIKRYTDPALKDVLMASSFLDGRFKSLPFCPNKLKNEVYDKVANMAAMVYHVTTLKPDPDTAEPNNDMQLPPMPTLDDTSVKPEQPMPTLDDMRVKPESNIDVTCVSSTSNKKRKTDAMVAFFGDCYIESEDGPRSVPAKSPVVLAKEEVDGYKMLKSLKFDDSPLIWWQKNESRFPMLAALAKTLLCIPGTSVPSERVFSTAGDILTANRESLKSHHVDKMLLLKKNMV